MATNLDQQSVLGPPDPLWTRAFTADELACFARRGGRLSRAEWLNLHGFSAPMVDFYERATGLPFCQADLAPLDMAMIITQKFNILKAILIASRNPEQNPGFFLIKEGFANITRLIDIRPDLQSSGRKSNENTPKVTSGLTPEFAQFLREKKKRRAERERQTYTTPIGESDEQESE